MEKHHCRYAAAVTLLMLFATPFRSDAQRAFFGAGIGAATLPRSLEPLCGTARRLTGPTLTAQAGFSEKRLRLSTSVNFTARAYSESADCVPKAGTYVDSVFAKAGNSATTTAVDIWLLPTRQLSVGVGAGWVPDHQSWFVSSGAGLQYRRIRAETTARWHQTSFDEVTREFTGQGVLEISRSSHTEGSWGGLVRLLIVTR